MLSSFDSEVHSSSSDKIWHGSLMVKFVEAGFVREDEVSDIASKLQKEKISLSSYLSRKYKTDAKVISQILADYLGILWFDLGEFKIDGSLCKWIDDSLIHKHKVFPLFVKEGYLYLAISEEEQLHIVDEIKFNVNMPIFPVVVENEKLLRFIDNYFSNIQYESIPNVLNSLNDENRVVEFVKMLLVDSINKGASDIHFEPGRNKYGVRVRVDGILHNMAQLHIDMADRINTRLKVMSNLDISERRLPQDGRFSFELNQDEFKDCRISSCPTLFGEKIVVRVLESENLSLSVDNLGFSEKQKNIFLEAIKNPQGMFLVTGPTGSGKTITLYTAINFLNTSEKNICTIEDPVEITLPGINQVNVNNKSDLSFSKVLRAFLRQDPDVIMLGEIRDKETAEIAIRASQTGHLVLSTLHTNSTSETLTRLVMMGIPAFNLIQSIHLIIAQRLVRKLCENCKSIKKYPEEFLVDMGFYKERLNDIEFYTATGCDYCLKGYIGRVGIFEFLPMSQSICNVISRNGSSLEIAKEAKRMGMLSLMDSALNIVKSGVTSLEEIQRVVPFKKPGY